MGNWNINIQGVGCHHNNDASIDADLMAKELVQKLKAAGHQIESASFTAGSRTDLKPVIVPDAPAPLPPAPEPAKTEG